MNFPTRKKGQPLPEFWAEVAAFEKTPEYQAWKAEDDRQRREKEQVERKEAEARRFAGLVHSSNVPRRAVEAVKGGCKDTAAIAAVREAPALTILAGGPGCGKTVAAVWWLMEAMRPLVDGHWGVTAAPNVAQFIDAAHLARWSRYDEEAMDKLLKCDRLVIDDLGNEYMDEKGAFLSVLNEVVINRYDNMRPTVLTTNLPMAKFRARYGDRIVDRLNEGEGFIGITDGSMRTGAK